MKEIKGKKAERTYSFLFNEKPMTVSESELKEFFHWKSNRGGVVVDASEQITRMINRDRTVIRLLAEEMINGVYARDYNNAHQIIDEFYTRADKVVK